MASAYMLGALTAGLFLQHACLTLVTSAAINVTDLHLENTAANIKNLGHWPLINSSNSSSNSGGDIISSDINSSGTENSTADGTYSVATRVHDTGPLHGNDIGSSPAGPAGVGKGQVMALSDDVITDALFTNIDALQDSLEICEEELRQKMKRSSYYQLMTESSDDASNTDNDEKAELANDVSDDYVNVPPLDVDEEGYLASDESPATDEHPHKPSQTRHQLARKRRFAVIAEPIRPLRKSDILSQKVVERLSERMSYLRSSLLQCHLLVRQFG